MTTTEPGDPSMPSARPNTSAAADLTSPPPQAHQASHRYHRARVCQAILLGVLALQTVLTLRLSGSRVREEGAYLEAGRAELSHLPRGWSWPADVGSLLSGMPKLFAVLAAWADGMGGLFGARQLSLLLTLATTVLLYSFTRRWFDQSSALAAAGLFAVLQSTAATGRTASPDAPAMLLLALAIWMVVRTGGAPTPALLLAAPVLVLAVGVTRSAALYVPTISALAVIVVWPRRREVVVRLVLLLCGIAMLWAVGVCVTDLSGDAPRALTSQGEGHGLGGGPWWLSTWWGVLMFAAAVGGALASVRRADPTLGSSENAEGRVRGRQRLILGSLLCCTALFASVCRMVPGSMASTLGYADFGLLFATPMAGVGLMRLMGSHFRHPQFGIALWVAVLCAGVGHADKPFEGWWPAISMGSHTVSRDAGHAGR